MFLVLFQGDQIPDDWHRGLIVKIQKKGDTTECTNWREIILVSVVSKVITRIIPQALEKAGTRRLP